MFWRSVRVAGVLGMLSLLVASACGGSSSNPGTDAPGGSGSSGAGRGGSSGSLGRAGSVESAGSAGKAATAGSAGASAGMRCGNATCTDATYLSFVIPACCADEATSQCGLDSSVLANFGPVFPKACQPLHQLGARDASCADTPPTDAGGIPLVFQGCCRANGTCGYLVDKIGGLFEVGLGCVDSTPFLDGGTPAVCGGGGAPGEGSEGGAAGASQSGAAGASELAVAGEGGSGG